jgi:hypothetical protein
MNFGLMSKTLSGEIVNLSLGIDLTLRELTDLIINRCHALLGYSPSVNFKDKSIENNGQKLVISNRKLKKYVDPKFNISKEIDKSLLNCIKWLL